MRRLTLEYLRTEAGAGLLLPAAALAAIALANSAYAPAYFGTLAAPVELRVGGFAETLSIGGWIRALLMPVFFLVIGMELKFELRRGELANPRRLALPILAALGGLAAPALVMALATGSGPARIAGWAAGSATDGAAALAALAIAGPRLAQAARVLLVSIAAADNLAALLLSAILSGPPASWTPVAVAVAVLVALVAMSLGRRTPFLFFAAGFMLVWALLLKSGLDPALAGFGCALAVPTGPRRPGQESTLKYFMESLHPYVAFAILPLFLFSAAGVPFVDMRLADLGRGVPLAVLLALVVAKPAGVLGLAAAGSALRVARRPIGVSWSDLAAVAVLSGVGLSISCYLAGAAAAAPIRAAVLAGSTAAALSGVGLLAWRAPSPSEEVARLAS